MPSRETSCDCPPGQASHLNFGATLPSKLDHPSLPGVVTFHSAYLSLSSHASITSQTAVPPYELVTRIVESER